MQRSGCRRGQRAQVVPIVAIISTVLLGATALAVDLGLQTHAQRSLQNITDAAALAGAQDLPASPAASDQYTAVQDALLLVHHRMGWPVFPLNSSTTNAAWAAAAAAPCSPAQNTTSPPICDISISPPSPYDNYVITVQTPARASQSVSHTDLHYLAVVISQNVRNNFGGAVGAPMSTDAARSTAYHFPGGQPYGFALFAKTFVQTQNSPSLVIGDVYADRYIAPQSQGKASLCAQGGLVILGAPQVPAAYDHANNPGQVDSGHSTAYPIRTISACGDANNPITTSGGTVNETRDPTAGCGVLGVSFAAAYDSDPNIKACVANPALMAPKLEQPSLTNPTNVYCRTQGRSGVQYSPGVYTCPTGSSLSLIGGDMLNPGVYEIRHDPSNTCGCYDFDISSSVNLTNVTIILEQGASMGIHGNGVAVTLTPYLPASPSVPTDGRFSIYAPPGSAASVTVDKNGAHATMYGTMYIPDGVAWATSNAYWDLHGQAIVGSWADQGGNHPSSDITYDGPRNAPQREVLTLVE